MISHNIKIKTYIMNNLINIINNQCETRNINKHITVSPPNIDNSNKTKYIMSQKNINT